MSRQCCKQHNSRCSAVARGCAGVGQERCGRGALGGKKSCEGEQWAMFRVGGCGGMRDKARLFERGWERVYGEAAGPLPPQACA